MIHPRPLASSLVLLVLFSMMGWAHRGGIGTGDASGPVRTADPRLLELRLLEIEIANSIIATVAPHRRDPIVLALANGLAAATVWQPLVLLLAAVLWRRGMGRLALWLMAVSLSAEVAAFVAKVLFHPAFPWVLLSDAAWHEERPDPRRMMGLVVAMATRFADYPSGHIVRVVADVVFLVAVGHHGQGHRRWATMGLCGAFITLVGIGRLTSGYHLPSAVVGGIVLGGSLSLAWVHGYRRGSSQSQSL